MREFFLSTVAKVLLIVGTAGLNVLTLYVKYLEIILIMIWQIGYCETMIFCFLFLLNCEVQHRAR